MIYTLEYHTDAEKEIIDAKKWYKSKQNGLEKNFAKEVKTVINYIHENPLMFEVKYRNTRVAFTNIFPYGIHYHINIISNVITILSVLHTSLNQENWTVAN
jgi:plasmid stabilization system protein ParE